MAYGAYGEVTVSGSAGSKTVTTEEAAEVSSNKKTYYHVTTPEAAEKIKESGELRHGQYETEVFVWTEQPTAAQAGNGGLGNKSVVLKFETSASFIVDNGVEKDLQKYARKSLFSSVSVSDVEEVGFRK